ncbi:MAG: LysR substrate-binding domain-containing protein, partial [Pseudomonadota bacterium]
REPASLTIACTHEVSHLYLLPRFESLQGQLGEDCQIRIMTYEYDIMEIALDPRIDIVIQYDVSRSEPQDKVAIVREAVVPLASADLVHNHPVIKNEPVDHWGDIKFLELSKQNYGWATWQDWFTQSGYPDFKPEYLYSNNYVYLLEAATAGKGIAMGWRGLIERHLESEALVPLLDSYIEFDRAIHAVLTANGRTREIARKCLELLVESDTKKGQDKSRPFNFSLKP